MASKVAEEERADELGPGGAAAWRAELGAWYARSRRDLPWRRSSDPYRVWISEAMLQQTRVEAVIPHYARFLARFPTVEALAAAAEDDVLAAWSGLGYYRRARALAAAARAIVAQHGGRFPRERRQALALPGVGPYTAAAVLSIAYGASEPLVDGNVARVLARVLALESPSGSGELQRRCEALAARLVPPAAGAGTGGAGDPDPGTWNQALMELGALVCTPRAPLCGACPWAARCAARARGLQGELPRPAARPATLAVRLEIALAQRGEEVLLVRRPAGGRMAGLWELPARELPDGDGRTHLWPPDLPAALRGLQWGEQLLRVSHAITRHRVQAAVRAAGAADVAPEATDVRWAAPGELASLPLAGLTGKVLRASAPGARAGATGGPARPRVRRR